MSVLFALLTVTIGGYTYLTDSSRVRIMAEGYLSELLGGRVEIGKATLSIFEGLRVEHVKVFVDRNPKKHPDSLLFSAEAFVLNYDPRKMLEGRLESSEIIAQKPQVFLTLTTDGDQDEWNYQRLFKNRRQPAPPGHGPAGKIVLPQILMRNAVIEIGEVRHGRRWPVGSMAVEGQLTPAEDGKTYAFELQTRGKELGPFAMGTVNADGRIDAHLRHLQFGDDIRSMLPANMGVWCRRHEIGGEIDTVDLVYIPGHEKIKPRFDIQVKLDGVTLAVHREEWSSREEVLRLQRLQNSIALLRDPYRMAGFRTGAGEEAAAGQHELSPVELFEQMSDTSPLILRDVTGTFEFNQDGISVPEDGRRHGLFVSVAAGDANNPRASNKFKVVGHFDGYEPGAPLRLEVTTADAAGLYFPARPRFMESLPADVRQFYDELKPEGHCRIRATVARPVADTAPRVSAEMEIVDARFGCRQFPYPFRGASGRIAFGRDPFSGKDYVTVMNMHGHGIVGGPNENAIVTVSGRVGPLGPENPEPGFDLHAAGTNISSEPALMAAMPPEVRKALEIFDAEGTGHFPQFKGNFVCNVHREPGPRQRFTFETDLDLHDASGRIKGFPYPLHNVSGTCRVNGDYVDILDVRIHDHGGVAKVTGRVRWNDDRGRDQPLDMSVNVSARGFPIDNDLLAAIPAEDGQWLRRLGVGGTLDVDGKIFTTVAADWRASLPPDEKPKDPPIRYDLAIGVRDGTIWPSDGLFSISAVTGNLHLTTDRLDILNLHGRREEAELAGSGVLVLSGPQPRMEVRGTARNLAMDRPLYALLPAEGRKAWDEVQPQGTVDAEVEYRRPLAPSPPGQIASVDSSIVLLPPKDDFRVILRPRKLSVRVKTAPYPLTFQQGSVTVTPGKAVIDHLVGYHGEGKLVVSGNGLTAAAPVWELALHAENLRADAELRKAMPPTLVTIVEGLKLAGPLGFDCTRLSYRAAATADGDPDIEVHGGAVTLKNGSMDVGMPLTKIYGKLTFNTATRQGKLESLDGNLAFDSLVLGGRPMRGLTLKLSKPVGRGELHVDHIQAKVAGGELAGGAVISFPDQGANRYTMNLILRDADVKQLTGETDQDIRGALTASLALEGAWGESAARRGRGDVVIAGKQLYRIPLMLGLLQVTNLSLPIGQPFTKGTARYNVDGTRVNFEQMDLRADGMAMSGTGYLDFGTKEVRMTLTTDNPGGFKVPFLSDLWQGARQELLRINVRGTVQEPKVQPTSMGTFTTTIDEVFKGDAGRK